MTDDKKSVRPAWPRRLIYVGIAIVVAGLVCRYFRPVRIVPLRAAQEQQQEAAFNAAAFAGKFWTNQLTGSLDKASDAATVLAALAQDAKVAAQRHGRRVGLGNSTFYLLRGRGTVVSVEPKGVSVSLRGAEAPADFLIQTGLLFGNALRDCTGLLDASAFPSSQHFNELSAELNRIVETQVIPDLKARAAKGRSIGFVVCAELDDESEQPVPLKVIPVSVQME